MDPSTVFCLDGLGVSKAALLAEDFTLPLVDAIGIATKPARERLRFLRENMGVLPGMAFLVNENVLQLALVDNQGVLAISARFHGSGVDYRRAKGGGRSEMIARAVGLRGQKVPSVVDATAGLGVDAFVLASLGCRVTMLERVPAVSALLRDALECSRRYASVNDPQLATILGRMELVRTDAVEYLSSLTAANFPDVIYLDPMFPERRKSAAVKKEMQLFHQLVGPDQDADRLFETALACAVERVVVKRPRIAPSFAGRDPSHRTEGKRNRYDVYLKTP
jgi:16S rRNA (guanine1516-N2)-methyltransferase